MLLAMVVMINMAFTKETTERKPSPTEMNSAHDIYIDENNMQENKRTDSLKWEMGVALYSFNQHSFIKAIKMAKEL